MRISLLRYFLVMGAFFAGALIPAGCGTPTGNTNLTAVNTNANATNSLANSSNINAIPANPTGSAVDAREPEQYQANVRLTLETIGQAQKASLPTLGATVARSGADRAMEFKLPNSETVIYLEKGNQNYLLLPNRKQYAELNEQSLGFEVRRLMMPAEIVQQVKSIPGLRLVGEENMNGRTVTKYAYSGTADTQTQAGTVATESFLIVDKETGLPLRSETVSQSQSGANVQGVQGLRVVTEMTDIEATPDPNKFVLPTDYQKIDPETVRAQVNLIFNAVAALVGQAIQQAQTAPAASPTPTLSPSPAR